MTKAITIKELLGEDDCTAQLEELTFEGGLSLLEELVDKVEGGELPLEQSILAYERGVALLGHLRGLVSGAEEKLTTLKKASNKKSGSKSK